jgi:hypothetical protein
MGPTSRRAWLANVVRFAALAPVAGCSPSEEMEPPNKRLGNSTKSAPPPEMKPQEHFDPRKRLRDKAAGRGK